MLTAAPDRSIGSEDLRGRAAYTLDILVTYGLAAYGGDPRVVLLHDAR